MATLIQAGPAAAANEELKVTIENLVHVDDGTYQVWVDVGGTPRHLGDLDHMMGWSGTFALPQADFDAATAIRVVLDVHPMGNMSNMSMDGAVTVLTADPSQGAMAAFTAPFYGPEWMGVTGSYVLATPTNGPDTDERSGVWFLDAYGGAAPEATLTVPSLEMTNWTYEAWVSADDMSPFFSIGRFAAPDGPDDACAYCGNGTAPAFPGEDLLHDLPEMLQAPLDLRGARVMVTVEPAHDAAPDEPFAFPVFEATVPSDAVDHNPYNLTDVTSRFASGSVDYTGAAPPPDTQSPTPGPDALLAIAAMGGVAVAAAGLRAGTRRKP